MFNLEKQLQSLIDLQNSAYKIGYKMGFDDGKKAAQKQEEPTPGHCPKCGEEVLGFEDAMCGNCSGEGPAETNNEE